MINQRQDRHPPSNFGSAVSGEQKQKSQHASETASSDASNSPRGEPSSPHLPAVMSSREIRFALAIASLGVIGLPRTTLAQQAEELSEVIVTATKRESVAQDTPMSIAVIGPEVLSSNHIDDFADFAFLVPGLTDTDAGPGNKRYALRGLQSPGEPEVALYYDEIPISGLPGGSLDTGASQPDLKLWDVDRIEVLRGPQGTLYGNGSEGGAIRIISNRPDLLRTEGALQVIASSTDGGSGSWGTNLMFNVPIVEGKFAVRAAFYDRDEGGYIDAIPRADIHLPQLDTHNINDERTRGGRASVGLQLADDWNVTGIMYYQRLSTGSSFETYPTYATSSDPYVSAAFVQTPWLDESHMYNVISQANLPWATLFVTGSYQLRKVSNNLDTTRYVLSLFGCSVTTWNQTCFGPSIAPADSASFESVSAWSAEARIVSSKPSPLQWTLGSALQNANTYRYGQVAPVNADGNIEYDPATGDAQERLFARQNFDVFDQYSFFASAGYEILSGLKANVGLRWFHSYRTDQQIIVQQFFPGQPTGPEPFQAFGMGVLFKSFELSYAPEHDSLVYVQAAQGFRAGGPNYPGGFTLTAPPYRADSVWDYELGTKLSFFGNRLRWNTAVFDIEWSNLQVLLPRALFSYISNAGSARSDGFEGDLDAQLSGNLDLIVGTTYNDARLVGAQPASSLPAAQLRAGDKLAGVPAWTGTLALVYKRPLGTRYTVEGRIDASYQSGRSSVVPPQNPAYFTAKAYTLTNFHLNFDRKDGWGVSMDIDNLFNRFAELSVQTEDSNLIETVTPARPLTLRLGVMKRF
jgi:iron complex outermembrane recepter protein